MNCEPMKVSRVPAILNSHWHDNLDGLIWIEISYLLRLRRPTPRGTVQLVRELEALVVRTLLETCRVVVSRSAATSALVGTKPSPLEVRDVEDPQEGHEGERRPSPVVAVAKRHGRPCAVTRFSEPDHDDNPRTPGVSESPARASLLFLPGPGYCRLPALSVSRPKKTGQKAGPSVRFSFGVRFPPCGNGGSDQTRNQTQHRHHVREGVKSAVLRLRSRRRVFSLSRRSPAPCPHYRNTILSTSYTQ